MPEHTIRLHTRKTIYLNLSLVNAYFTFYRLARHILCCQFYSLSLENDDMESSKRCVKLLSNINNNNKNNVFVEKVSDNAVL